MLVEPARIAAASPAIPLAGTRMRRNSVGSMSIRMILSLSSVPQADSGRNMRVPTASTTSALGHRAWPPGSEWLSTWRLSSTPLPRRKPTTGAASRSASARTSAAASYAPPPTKITGHSAAASICAARAIASSSSGAGGSGGSGPATRPPPCRRARRAALRARPGAGGRCAAPEGARHQAGRVFRPLDPFGRFGERAQDAELIGDLVQMAEALSDRAARDLADQRQHFCAGRVGGGERGAGLRKPGPGTTE